MKKRIIFLLACLLACCCYKAKQGMGDEGWEMAGRRAVVMVTLSIPKALSCIFFFCFLVFAFSLSLSLSLCLFDSATCYLYTSHDYNDNHFYLH